MFPKPSAPLFPLFLWTCNLTAKSVSVHATRASQSTVTIIRRQRPASTLLQVGFVWSARSHGKNQWGQRSLWAHLALGIPAVLVGEGCIPSGDRAGWQSFWGWRQRPSAWSHVWRGLPRDEKRKETANFCEDTRSQAVHHRGWNHRSLQKFSFHKVSWVEYCLKLLPKPSTGFLWKTVYCIFFRLHLIYLLGWSKSLFSFFHKIKDTYFIFTNNLIDLDIGICQLPSVW